MSSERVRILNRLQALGERYLALRGELGEVLHEAGLVEGTLPAEPRESVRRRRCSILGRLERGEIGVEEAVRALEATPLGAPLEA